ncbi:ATPase, T2SS/T4P/T4SS family, partial [Thermus sp.]|uniref:ATPase, T2SS/T4P/T4SS family n=1 Tax=Thermus sp. TaxID=275 RepID=UPI002618A6D4
IVTIEDPIEYVFFPQRSAIHQREVGSHTESFAKALRSAMRQAPDVIMVGEMRDGETIKAALTAAETGHLVLSTLHTRSAPESIIRIVDALPPEDKPMARQQLSASLAAVISQKLL